MGTKHTLYKVMRASFFMTATIFSCLTFSAIGTVEATYAAPGKIEVIAMPHPDDEMEVWSQIQGSTANYKVFAYLTRGEETSYCNTDIYRYTYSPGLNETSTSYIPTGQLSYTCYESRITSTLNFLNRMSTTDSAVPGGFSATNYTTVNLPLIGTTTPGHVDNGTFIADRSVRIYNSTNGTGTMGKVLFFNLGNNDLTTAEAVWALKSIMNRRSTLGLPNLPFYTMIGPFSHTTSNSYPNCQIYDHIDHYAIHDALFNYNLGMPTPSFQAAATCATDPDYQVNPRTAWVSSTAYDNAFYVNPVTLQRVGFFQRDYGWMDWNDSVGSSGTSGMGWYANPSTTTQISTGSIKNNSPFMKYQTFWQRFVR